MIYPKLRKDVKIFLVRPAERHRPEKKGVGCVISTGPKYFYVAFEGEDVDKFPHTKIKFYTHNWREVVRYGNANHQIYPSEEIYNTNVERAELFRQIASTRFDAEPFTLEELRQIVSIIITAGGRAKGL